jgi:hypothetical protein
VIKNKKTIYLKALIRKSVNDDERAVVSIITILKTMRTVDNKSSERELPS